MASGWDAFAKAAPKAAAPAKPKAAAPAPAPGLWDRAVADVKGLGDGIASAFDQREPRKAAGTAQLTRESKGSEWDRYAGRIRDNHQMRDAGADLKRDFTAPLDKSKGWAAFPARAGKTALDAVGAVFSPIAAAATVAAGPEAQALTGVDKETFGNLASGAVPVGGAAKLLPRGVRALAKERAPLARPGNFRDAAEPAANVRAATKARAAPKRDFTAPPKPEAAPRPVKPAAPLRQREGALGAAQRTFAPETVSENARTAASLHRMNLGKRVGEAASEGYKLERHYRDVTRASPAEQEALAKYVDTRKPGETPLNPKLQDAADTMRGVYTRYRSRIENVLGDGEDGPKFVEEYYARLWKNPPQEVAARVQTFGGKQGSGRSLLKRSIPTYEEGLAAGLEPVFKNPLDATRAYTDNMAHFLATNETLQGLRDGKLAKWEFDDKITPGKVKLQGIKTTMRADLERGLPVRSLVADPDVALVYNRTVSKGLDRGSFAPVYRGARAVSNAATQLKLSFSLFHGTVMGEEGFVSGAAKGLNRVARGDLKGAADIFKSPAAFVTTARKGGNLRRAILDPENIAQHLKGMDPRLADIYQRAGGRVNMERFYNSSNVSGGFWRGIKNGTIGREVGDALKALPGSPIRGSIDLGLKTLDTLSAPIFKEYVPRMKAGAWASRMEQWLRDNPEASAVEQQRYAENLVQTIDNRFGEVIIDNNFWDKAHFQLAQLAMLSPSWNLGTVREIGGGVADLPKSIKSLTKGEGVTDKTAYVLALAGTYTLQNGLMTYLHTGEAPEGQDWIAYRTGELDKDGKPQRGMIPGYAKDVLGFAYDFPHHVVDEATGKMNPALASAGDIAMNEDHFKNPVYTDGASLPQQLGETAKFAGQQVEPINFSQGGTAPGFTAPESALGIRKAPAYLENPEKFQANKEKYGKQAMDRKEKFDAKRSAPSDWSSFPKSDKPAAKAKDDSWSVFPAAKASTTEGLRMKPGAMMKGAELRPEFKPVVKLVEAVPAIRELTAGNDSYHPAGDVHADGRAGDFNLAPGANHAEVAARIRAKLKAAGIRATVSDEYASPSRRATAGHIHVSIPRA